MNLARWQSSRAGSPFVCVSVEPQWVNLFSEAPMTLIWTTTMAPFSSLAHAWLDSLNMFQGEISRSPRAPHSALWCTERRTRIHMWPLNLSHMLQGLICFGFFFWFRLRAHDCSEHIIKRMCTHVKEWPRRAHTSSYTQSTETLLVIVTTLPSCGVG